MQHTGKVPAPITPIRRRPVGGEVIDPDLDAVVAQHEDFRRFPTEGEMADPVPMLREHVTGRHSRARGQPPTNTMTVNEEKNDVPIA